MSSAKLNVTVYDGPRRVETLAQRPVRLMPDDRAGVVYAGEVYPLYDDDSIRLEDQPVDKNLCYRFVGPNGPVPYARASRPARLPTQVQRWHLESNRFGHYLVFDGSRSGAEQLVRRVRDSGIRVVRWDESVRTADNGEMYDWFIRLDFDGTAAQCRQAVAPLLGGGSSTRPGAPAAAPATAPSPAVLLELTKLQERQAAALQRLGELEVVVQQAAELEKALQVSEARSHRLEGRVQELEEQLRQQATTWTREIQKLRAQAADARSERDAALRQTAASANLEIVLAAQASAEEEWLIAAEEAETLRSERDDLRANLARVTADLKARDVQIEQLSDAVTEMADADQQRRARRGERGPQGGPYEDFVSRLLPRTDLDPDDLELLREWPSPRDAVLQLLTIDQGGRPRESDGVKGRPGWTEVRGVNTGKKNKENLGRLYYRKVNQSGRVRVCLHDKEDKKEQSRFIDRLPDV